MVSFFGDFEHSTATSSIPRWLTIVHIRIHYGSNLIWIIFFSKFLSVVFVLCHYLTLGFILPGSNRDPLWFTESAACDWFSMFSLTKALTTEQISSTILLFHTEPATVLIAWRISVVSRHLVIKTPAILYTPCAIFLLHVECHFRFGIVSTKPPTKLIWLA